ncbi:MAG: hypothetical protein R3C68_19895 [Myxococcota bacterium]
MPSKASWINVPFSVSGHPDSEKNGKFLLTRIEFQLATPLISSKIDLSNIPDEGCGGVTALQKRVARALAAIDPMKILRRDPMLKTIAESGRAVSLELGLRIELMDKHKHATIQPTAPRTMSGSTRVYFFP